MLSDRSYMRRDSGRPSPGFLAWFMGLLVGVFVLQTVLVIWFDTDSLERFASLSANNLRAGRVWTVLTYVFIHGSALHLVANAIGAFMLVRALDEHLSVARLVQLTIATALGGAGLWLAIHHNHYGRMAGASAVLSGYLCVFVCLAPRAPLFLIPAPRYWLLIILGFMDVAGLLFRELPSNALVEGSVSHSAHLGGLAAGWLFYQFVLARPVSRSRAAIEPPPWLSKKIARSAPAYSVNLDSDPAAGAAPAAPDRDAVRAEVDRILDKINLHGFGSLTLIEKRTLDEARQHLSHH